MRPWVWSTLAGSIVVVLSANCIDAPPWVWGVCGFASFAAGVVLAAVAAQNDGVKFATVAERARYAEERARYATERTRHREEQARARYAAEAAAAAAAAAEREQSTPEPAMVRIRKETFERMKRKANLWDNTGSALLEQIRVPVPPGDAHARYTANHATPPGEESYVAAVRGCVASARGSPAGSHWRTYAKLDGEAYVAVDAKVTANLYKFVVRRFTAAQADLRVAEVIARANFERDTLETYAANLERVPRAHADDPLSTMMRGAYDTAHAAALVMLALSHVRNGTDVETELTRFELGP
jgi:hypothetical protein